MQHNVFVIALQDSLLHKKALQLKQPLITNQDANPARIIRDLQTKQLKLKLQVRCKGKNKNYGTSNSPSLKFKFQLFVTCLGQESSC